MVFLDPFQPLATVTAYLIITSLPNMTKKITFAVIGWEGNNLCWFLICIVGVQINTRICNFLTPRPHVSRFFWIRNFFFPDSKISPFTRSAVFKSNSLVSDGIRTHSSTQGSSAIKCVQSMRHKARDSGICSVAFSSPEAAILLVSDGDRDLWPSPTTFWFWMAL